MVCEELNFGEINVLVSEADWAWPLAVRDIFQPRGVGMLLAKRPNDVLDIMRHKRIHTAIVDFDSESMSGMGAVRIIRAHNPLLPCIMLAECIEQKVLKKAIELDVFSVIEKPVNFDLLRQQLNKLFVKRYGIDVFGR
jgi:DNA-binding NtrC family response regulator